MTHPDTPAIDPADEHFWSGIRAHYAVSSDFINLENGYFSLQATPVFDAFQRYNDMVNREASRFLRTEFPARVADVMQSLSDFTGAPVEELVLTRNLIEAMNILIQGYPFRPGDEAVLSTQDYESVTETFDMVRQRKGIVLKKIALPLDPQDDTDIVALYENAITPNTRVILVTHMIHLTGQIVPVAKIADMARRHGVDVMVDAAHSFAQVDYRMADLNSDFVAVNLHKWLGAPLGVGLLHIRKERIAHIAPLFGDTSHAPDDIRKFTHTGTTPPAPILAIPDAIAFHHSIGGRNKEARLRYLKQYWTDRVRGFGRIEMLTPLDPQRSCAIAAFCVAGMRSQEVVDYLHHEHGIFTVGHAIEGRQGVRVTPHLYTSTADLDRLVTALQRFA